jgi:hypothetical protein
MDALEFYKSHESAPLPNVGDLVSLTVEELCELMEQYHQSKVNFSVNKRAFNVAYLADDEIVKVLVVLAESEEEAMSKALELRNSRDIYSAIEVNVC